VADKQLSNWGKWGANDQRGTLNYVTPYKVKQAIRLVKKGQVYSLACVLGGDGPYHIGSIRKQPWRFTAIAKLNTSRRSVGFAEDMLAMSTHSGTHIDALCHVWYNDRLYNGFSSNVIEAMGASKNSIENVKSLVGRGIMLDVAGNKQVKHLNKGYAVTPQDLEDCLEAEGLKTKPGDIILVRTGWMQVYHEEGVIAFQGGVGMENYAAPGLSYHVARWLHQKQTCAVGLDNWGCEVFPPELPGHFLRFHQIFLRDMGGYVMESLVLDELAQNKVYEFLFVAAPLQVSCGVGSPLNPLAIV